MSSDFKARMEQLHKYIRCIVIIILYNSKDYSSSRKNFENNTNVPTDAAPNDLKIILIALQVQDQSVCDHLSGCLGIKS